MSQGIVEIHSKFFTDFLNMCKGEGIHISVKRKDLKVVAMNINWEKNCLQLLVESSDIPETEPGKVLPIIDVVAERIYETE